MEELIKNDDVIEVEETENTEAIVEAESSHTGLKVLAGGALIAAAGYGVYKIAKEVGRKAIEAIRTKKMKKAEAENITEVSEDEITVVDNE